MLGCRPWTFRRVGEMTEGQEATREERPEEVKRCSAKVGEMVE